AFLKAGPNRDLDSTAAAKLQEAHLKNIFRMAKEGKLLMAGPFMDDTEIRGIYIFDVRSIEEAQKLTETDPAIKAGSLVMELHPWYGSAVLPLLVPLHKKVEKNSIVD
ncbi:MAG TPA: YciI family protein, partial [Haliscomenobacter sp.]|nr:YciI family protein [Haliscomenobacter sp.]